MTKKALQAYFQTQLLNWASTIQRDLPWKGNKNAYYIWLSEIILQQTKVQQGKPYYEKFIAKYPDIEALALAPEDDILKLWQGLGYYARARNMQQAAQSILRDHQGQFPKTYEDILALKGVGEYTAAAIASFAFDLAYAVVDGNVYRVLSRFFGIDIAINTSKGRQLFQQLANVLLDTHKPAVYNQAIMDFGAIHCKPKKTTLYKLSNAKALLCISK